MADTFSQKATLQVCSDINLPQILDIYNHYGQNSSMTFDTETKPLSDLQATYHTILQQGLPYIVAVLPSRYNAESDLVVGYAYVTQFRPHPAYAGSVEISVSTVIPNTQGRVTASYSSTNSCGVCVRYQGRLVGSMALGRF